MSWRQLVEIFQADIDDRKNTVERPPVSCPNDGEPLLTGPEGKGILFCPFDGWQYPRDGKGIT